VHIKFGVTDLARLLQRLFEQVATIGIGVPLQFSRAKEEIALGSRRDWL
jgi:hypothetical protein